MKTILSAFTTVTLLIFANSTAIAESLLMPAYVSQTDTSSTFSPFPMPSTQELVGPIFSITSGLPPLGPNENLGLIHQNGANNVASIAQTGGRNVGLIQQAGFNNSAAVQQVGMGHQAFVSQGGTGNIAFISQR